MSEKLESSQPSEVSIPVHSVSSSTPVNLTERLNTRERIDNMRTAIERRAYELFMGDGAADGRDVNHWVQAEAELLHPVHLSIVESNDALTVKAELPGFSANEIQVSLEGRLLTIVGKRESSTDEQKGKAVYQEQCSTEIFRSVALPADVDASNAAATLKDGVLALVLPKAAEAKAPQGQAKAAGGGA